MKSRRWRPVEEIIPERWEQGTERVLLKDQYGNVVIGAWRPFGGPWMLERDTQPAGARYDVFMRLPK